MRRPPPQILIISNHSDTPNTESREVDREDEVITGAKRDIQPGEELTDDYRTFEANFVRFSPYVQQ
jgi:SET domain-containing protein